MIDVVKFENAVKKSVKDLDSTGIILLIIMLYAVWTKLNGVLAALHTALKLPSLRSSSYVYYISSFLMLLVA